MGQAQGTSQVAPETLVQSGPQVMPMDMEVDLRLASSARRGKRKGDGLRHQKQPSAGVLASRQDIPHDPIIRDTEHGVICRIPRPSKDSGKGSGKTRQANVVDSKGPSTAPLYFHPRLRTQHDQGTGNQTESPNLHRVIRGPKKDAGRRLHYVIGRGSLNDASLEANRPTSAMPQGKGYQWPSTYRSPETRHFLVTFLGEEAEGDHLESASGSDVNILSSSSNTSVHGSATNHCIRLSLRATSTADNICSQLGLHLLQPPDQVKLYLNKAAEPIPESTVMSNLADADNGTWENFVIELTEF